MRKALWWILLLIVLVVLAVIYRPGKNSWVDGVNDTGNSANENDRAWDADAAKNDDEVEVAEADVVAARVNTAKAVDEKAASEADIALAANTEWFMEYNVPEAQAALNDGKRVALFFHADRCPTCRALAQDIQDNLADIDEKTLIYQVDYDTEVALKKKYGVTSQHTIVYLDENMEAEKISRGIPTLEQLLANFSS